MAAVDFFISYASADRAWAEWVAWQLQEARYSVRLQAWDFRPGRDFLHEMQRATTDAKRTIAILSPDYFASEFGETEWRAVFAKDPTGERGLLVPVRVRDFRPPGLLGTRVYIDLVGTTEDEAVDSLLRGVSELGARPTRQPPFPGLPSAPATNPRFPGGRPGERHLPLDWDSPLPSGFTRIWLSLQEQPRALPPSVAIDPRAFNSLNDLLDSLFVGYLHGVVSPYSYGAEWVLTLGVDLLVAPVDWSGTEPSRSGPPLLHGPPPSP